MANYSNASSFPEAVELVLRMLGTEVLCEPMKFSSAICDIYDPECRTPEMQILVRNCDGNLLEYFNQALLTYPTNTDALQAAANQTCEFLVDKRMISRDAAEVFSRHLLAGIYQYVGQAQSVGASTPPITPDSHPNAPAAQNQAHDDKGQEDESKEDESRSKPGGFKRFVVNHKVIIIVMAVALIVVFSAISFVRKNTTSIRFDGGGADEGMVPPISGLAGTKVALPENGYVYDDHVFAGWRDTSSYEANPKPLQPGDLVTLGESWYFSAVWNAEITFDGNGADVGEMDTVLADTQTEYTFPECDYKREGYVFIGWASEPDSTYVYAAGENGFVGSNTTYYAIWNKGALVIEETVDKEGKKTKTIDEYDSANSDVVVMLRNDSDKNMSIDIDAKYKSETGGILQDSYTYAQSVAPGETRCISTGLYCDDKTPSGISYTIEATEAYAKPLSGSLHVKETSITDDGVAITVKNDGNIAAQLGGITMLGKTKEGAVFIASDYLGVGLEPGESAESTISTYRIPTSSGVSIEDLERTYYVDGYLDDYDW